MTAGGFFRKKILAIFWIVLLLHCLFQYLKWPYVAVTKPMLVPLLMAYLLVRDNNIGKPVGKFIFYMGMFLALFGDVLLISINDTFFLSGMIAFMLMNISYSIAFLKLTPLAPKAVLPLALTAIILFITGYWFYDFLAAEMGAYAVPVLAYMVTVSFLVLGAVNVALTPVNRPEAIRYFIPGALIFLIENVFVALNRFHFDSNKDVYIGIMFTYGLAQYLFVRGVEKAYLRISNR